MMQQPSDDSVTLNKLHPMRTIIAAGYLQKAKRRHLATRLGDTAYTIRYFVLTKTSLYYFRKVGLYVCHVILHFYHFCVPFY